jgi:hypothetical protein
MCMSIANLGISLDDTERVLTLTVTASRGLLDLPAITLYLVTRPAGIPTSQWMSPRLHLGNIAPYQTVTVTAAIPMAPDEDFLVTGWLDVRGHGVGANRAYGRRAGVLIGAWGFLGLDQAVLEDDLRAGRIDEDVYRRRNHELHRVPSLINGRLRP